jgi:hypothetical protein
MKVRIHGPNLRNQRLGTFHVHADGCGDNRMYGPGKREGGEDSGWVVEAACKADVADWMYGEAAGDFDGYEYGRDEFVFDFHYAPCVDLPLFDGDRRQPLQD